jgi:hypothetical protein
MDEKNRYVCIALFIALFAVQAVGATTVSIENVFVEPDGNVTASIMIGNVTNAGVADINLTFDQSAVHVTGAENSDFDFMHVVINNSAGVTRIGAFQISSPGLNGDVKLANVLLDAVGSAGEASVLNLSINELKEVSTPETPIYAEVDNGTFAIINPPEPPVGISSSTGCHWINWTWASGPNSDFVEVRIDGVLIENCTKPSYHCTYPPHATRTISLRGYNLSLNRYSEYVSQTTTIPNHAPVAIAEAMHIHNNAGYQCKAIFDASASYDPDSDCISYDWDFGDESNGSDSVVEHTYMTYNWNSSGYEPFTVSLRVADDIGDSATVSIYMNVYIAGDANGDGVVDVLDATILGIEWDRVCIGNWNDRSDQADLNNDCCVDILDAVIIGTNWGDTAY